MDIESIVAKVTQEVLKTLEQSPDDGSVDLLPPPGRGKVSKGRDLRWLKEGEGERKVCEALRSGECAGVGCCAQLIPDKVRTIIDCGADRIGNALGGEISASDIAARIDHTLLKPDATKEQVVRLCNEAIEFGFASVCVNPAWVSLAAELLRGTSVKVCTVVGFPLGATTTLTKVVETKEALANGADEIDMVINVGALKDHRDDVVERDIREVARACQGHTLKVILETALLSDDEVVRGCLLAKRAGADYVKTSTGFGPGGATAHHVSLMRRTVGPRMGVKASGGVRDIETAREMLKAGATRIGASASVKIVKGEQEKPGSY